MRWVTRAQNMHTHWQGSIAGIRKESGHAQQPQASNQPPTPADAWPAGHLAITNCLTHRSALMIRGTRPPGHGHMPRQSGFILRVPPQQPGWEPSWGWSLDPGVLRIQRPETAQQPRAARRSCRQLERRKSNDISPDAAARDSISCASWC
ncbi:hypothetical protein K458DRAFT_32879 [Lentithecium fluviatile CBS 122367]|uniref:Uncharacterized protein n=1 Tax=Lentithecium fluviatile CBS 122367 TaxID=1168545 RepID=A0A6G1J1V9_9PLEO|nr:hypothetical protein K458DRAFT_32879 [Lentithecium fluviatile CBS 122367]